MWGGWGDQGYSRLSGETGGSTEASGVQVASVGGSGGKQDVGMDWGDIFRGAWGRGHEGLFLAPNPSPANVYPHPSHPPRIYFLSSWRWQTLIKLAPGEASDGGSWQGRGHLAGLQGWVGRGQGLKIPWCQGVLAQK